MGKGDKIENMYVKENDHDFVSLSFLTVCQPCLDDWVQFQSSCYMFAESNYYYNWKSWEGSQEECRDVNADLVVIESQEEQARLI